MKRITRKMSETTKQRISAKLKGKMKSTKHKEAISKGMENYWKTIPDYDENQTEDNKQSKS
mgnify:CR=1 FL=1|jgi:hypothetical protein